MSRRKDKLPGEVVRSLDSPTGHRALKTFFSSIPTDKFQEACGLDPKFQPLAEALTDPAYRSFTIGSLVTRFGLTVVDCVELWRSFHHNLGLIEVLPMVPQIYKDTFTDAQAKLVGCDECKGTGDRIERKKVGKEVVEYRVKCYVCEGTGKVRIQGDKDARTMVFETMGMIGQKPTQVNINSNNTTSTANVAVDLGSALKTVAQTLNLTRQNRTIEVEAEIAE